MKGIVLEIENQKIIVMDESGQFIELSTYGKKYTVGEEIAIPRRTNQFSNRFAVLAASLMLLVFSGAGFGAYYYPQGYINIDVNPSIEISYNLFERVIGSRGLNLEGQEIVEKLGEFKNQSIDYAVKQYVDEIELEGYISETDNHLALITINGKDPNNQIMQSIVDDFDQFEMTYDLAVADGSKETYRRHLNLPKEIEVSPGDYNLMEKIQQREMISENEGNSEEGNGALNQNGKTTQEMIEEIKQKGKEDEIHEIKGQNKAGNGASLQNENEMTIEQEKIVIEEELQGSDTENGKKEGGKK